MAAVLGRRAVQLNVRLPGAGLLLLHEAVHVPRRGRLCFLVPHAAHSHSSRIPDEELGATENLHGRGGLFPCRCQGRSLAPQQRPTCWYVGLHFFVESASSVCFFLFFVLAYSFQTMAFGNEP